jgi:hypothetical protein
MDIQIIRDRRKRNAPKPSPRELAIYNGRDLVGTVTIIATDEVKAYDANGKCVGAFPSLEAASDALDRSVVRP